MIKLKSLVEIKKYDINKHYQVDKTPVLKVKDLVDSILKDIKPLIYELGFINVKLNYVVQDRISLARYNGIIDSTGEPIITMSTKILHGWVKKYGHNLDREVERVIVHELGHAYLELCGINIISQNKILDKIETVIEEFAQTFVEDRNIKNAKKIIDDFVEDYNFYTGNINEDINCPRCKGWKHVYVRAGIPNIITKCPICVDIPKDIKVYRGVSEYNKKYDNFWTTDKEWARQFTQSGLDKEIKQRTINTSVIMKRENAPLPNACNDKDFDQAIKDAEFGKFDAFWINEGQGEPPSIYIIHKEVLK